MSYTTSIKNELVEVSPEKRCCRLAEIAGLINTSADMSEDGGLRFRTENWAVARKYFTLLKKTFNIEVERSYIKKTKAYKNSVFELKILSSEQIDKVISSTGTAEGTSFSRHISGLVVKGDCCRRAYIRGAFLAGGSVSSPEKGYHLEISLKSEENAEHFVKLLAGFEIGAKILQRQQGVSVYAKDSAKIADFLNASGAKNALFFYENAKAMKEVRNGVNRLVNCDTANIKKTVDAAQKQIEAIMLIERTAGISTLNVTLRQTAEARINNPELKLEELGSILGIGKSGVNHRLRKIEAIAMEIELNNKGD